MASTAAGPRQAAPQTYSASVVIGHMRSVPAAQAQRFSGGSIKLAQMITAPLPASDHVERLG